MTPQERIALLDKQLQLLAKKSETAEGDQLDKHISLMVSICNEIRYSEKDNTPPPAPLYSGQDATRKEVPHAPRKTPLP